MKKTIFIYNGKAGKNQISVQLSSIIDILNRNGFEVIIYSTQHKHHATELAKKYGAKYEYLFCSGGDGTLSEVVAGLMQLPKEQRPKVAYIPAGSTNDYAVSLGLSKDIKKCAEEVSCDHYRAVDIGYFNEQTFNYVAAFGAFTEVSYSTPQEEKNILGHQAYIIEGIKQLPSIKPVHMKITINEGQVIEGDFIYGMVSNTISVGGFKGMPLNDVLLDDGYFELLLVENPPNLLIELPTLLTNLLIKNSNYKYFHSFKIKKADFDTEEEVKWVLDGEFGGAQTHVHINNCENALWIAIPPVQNTEQKEPKELETEKK